MKPLYLILFFSIVFSCTNSKTELSQSFVGKWSWVATDGGIGYHIHQTPESSGKVVFFYLLENNSFKIEINGVVTHSGTYAMSEKNSIYNGNLSPFITISENTDNEPAVFNGIISSSENSQLQIADNNYDGVSSVYVRIQ